MRPNGVRLVGTTYRIVRDPVQDANGPMVTEHWDVPAELLGK
jgi:hypothetical protein